jgi:large subunit ribosomal protein L28
MSRTCQVTGVRPLRGSKIHRRGLAKKQGGIGMHVTAVTTRWFYPNLHKKRIFVPELDRWVHVKLTSKALKTIAKNGAYTTLLEAGIIKPVAAKKRAASSQQ